MYIIKNAFRSIGRSKGRNILIGIIALVIAVSACLGLSIRQAAESAKVSALEGMSVTASISYDRAGAMNKMSAEGGFDRGDFNGEFDRNVFSGMMGSSSSLTVDEYELYATAESVSDFYYTVTAYFDGSEEFVAVSDEEETEEDTDAEEVAEGRPEGFPGGMGGFGGMGGMSGFGGMSKGDFTVVGYSSDSAMTEFTSGSASVMDGGAMFEEGSESPDCVISEELALYNNISVGDKVTLTNPSLETETYELTVTGIYSSGETGDFSLSFLGKSQDPANRIYMSAAALQVILDASGNASETVTDEDTGREYESAVTGNVSATYSFEDVTAYEKFEDEARELGLEDSYVISSSDITAYENSLSPLNTLSDMAKWFLLVILIIGGVILVVLNIFNIRERKYEVGVLTAMGMKKGKVAVQFVCEILVVTMIAVILGAAIGGISSVPVTNALLAGQVESRESQQNRMDNSFGRPGNMPGGMGQGMPDNLPDNLPDGMEDVAKNNPFEQAFGNAANYVSEVDSAMNITVALQMIGIGLLLTLVASAASVLFIMRYDPLKILSNRD